MQIFGEKFVRFGENNHKSTPRDVEMRRFRKGEENQDRISENKRRWDVGIAFRRNRQNNIEARDLLGLTLVGSVE